MALPKRVDDAGAGRREKTWWDRVKPYVECTGVVLLAVYTGFTVAMYFANKEAADAAASAAATASKELKEIQQQTLFTRRQSSGTMGAIVRFAPDWHWSIPNLIIIRLSNEGHVLSPRVNLSFTATRVSIPSLAPLSQLPPYSVTVVQLPVGPNERTYRLPFALEHYFAQQKETLEIKGTLTYEDGFREEPFSDSFCYIYVGEFSVNVGNTPDFNAASYLPCPGLRERLRRVYSHIQRQTR